MSLAREIEAVRFSIDPWMQTLFSQDMKALDYSWIIERVERCCKQIWEVSQQLLLLGGTVILDLGFTTKSQRMMFVNLANKIDVVAEIHYLTASPEIRKARVKQRNRDKDPNLYSFEVTDLMFNFIEPKFEAPDEQELMNGKKITCEQTVA